MLFIAAVLFFGMARLFLMPCRMRPARGCCVFHIGRHSMTNLCMGY